MIREVNLSSYLPQFMQSYKEPVAALKAENPEFQIIWEAADRVFRNRFIATADEYGISRFEKMLHIYPSNEDTLENRRSMVQSKWFNKIPYTIRVLLQKLTVLCGDTDFLLTNDFDAGYTLILNTNLETFGRVKDLEELLNNMLPCNIAVISENAINFKMEGKEYFAGIIGFSEIITISN